MVEMRDVSVVYSGGVDALHNVNLKINDGDFAFVVGPSGAGKSTMIKLILKEINPSSGTVFVNGYHLGKLKQRQVPALRRTIGFVFQDFRLIPSMTVYENIAFVLRVIDAPTSDIEKRDYNDMHRDISPLKQADDAVLLDSSDMNIEQVTEAIMNIFKNAVK